MIDAGPGGDFAQPADLLREIHRHCQPRARRLLLFESVDSMVRSWGVSSTREFFARCCPLLLEVGAIAYWTMSARDTPASVQETVQAVTQCVLRVDERSVRVVKAEGRDDAVRGSVLHWHEDAGRPVLEPAGDRRPRRDVAALDPPRAHAQPARPRRPRGRDGERDLAGRAGRAGALAGDARPAERGAGGHRRRAAARRGSGRLPHRPPDRGPPPRPRPLAHAARRRPTRTCGSTWCTSTRASPARRRAPPGRGRGSSPSRPASCRCKVAGQTPADAPRGGAGRRHRAGSRGGGTSGSPRPCCSGSSSPEASAIGHRDGERTYSRSQWSRRSPWVSTSPPQPPRP